MLSIIIVNYNTVGLTCACIESIYRYTRGLDFEVIVVDNASPTEDPGVIAERFPQVQLIRAPRNGGFAYGNNLGIAAASGEYILLLNSDTYLTDNALLTTLTWYQQQGGEGPCCLRLAWPDGRYQTSARRFRSITREVLDILRPVLWCMPYRRRATLMLNQYFRCDFDTECDWVSGAFMLFPKALLARLPEGRLDERYFMYGEDQLWCWQMKNLGAGATYFSGATVVHIAGGSTDPEKLLRLRKLMQQRELDILALRKGRGLYYAAFKIIFGTKERLNYGLKAIAGKVSGKRLR